MDPTAVQPTARPRHLWIVGGLSLLWNAFGAVDYLMTQLQVESYLSGFTQEQLDYWNGFPAWVDACWAIGVWGSVLGSVALLLRQAWAQWAFALSLVGLAGSSLYTYGLTDGLRIMGGAGPVVFSVLIWVVAIALFIYARVMARRHVLR
ncbi:MAG: hypothetical protein R3181_00090 [Rubricoccaceae bacterium]|nr:hypothetical protein [Rubricoccaceae bacterium]